MMPRRQFALRGPCARSSALGIKQRQIVASPSRIDVHQPPSLHYDTDAQTSPVTLRRYYTRTCKLHAHVVALFLPSCACGNGEGGGGHCSATLNRNTKPVSIPTGRPFNS